MQDKKTLQPKHAITQSLLNQRKVFLWGMVEDSSAKDIVEQMLYLSSIDNEAPIHFHINSPGGVVTAGFAIHDTMQHIPNPVYTYCMGFAASMGSILLSAGEKGHRYIYPYAEVMIHQPSVGGFQANSTDIEINAKHIIRTKQITAELLAANCDQTVKKILSDFDRDYWMDADEALEYGIVDQMV